ncbi:hypothetical protein GOODEAATRI_009525, partial [Goodea atripinnis]
MNTRGKVYNVTTIRNVEEHLRTLKRHSSTKALTFNSKQTPATPTGPARVNSNTSGSLTCSGGTWVDERRANNRNSEFQLLGGSSKPVKKGVISSSAHRTLLLDSVMMATPS